MLVIRNEQNEALRACMRSHFEEKAMEDLRKRFPRKVGQMPADELLNLVRSGRRKAEKFKITTEYDIIRFLEQLVEFGEDFGRSEETSWAGPILQDPKLSGRRKMDRIVEHETFARR